MINYKQAGKTGLDAWNFTVAPTSAACDPTGAYIRRWVPELAALPTKYLREPWTAPFEVLAKAGVQLGVTYPERITTEDMSTLRERNAALMRAARFMSPEWIDAAGYDLIPVPPGATVAHDHVRMRIFTKHEYRTPEGDGKAPRGAPPSSTGKVKAAGGGGGGETRDADGDPTTSGAAASTANANAVKKRRTAAGGAESGSAAKLQLKSKGSKGGEAGAKRRGGAAATGGERRGGRRAPVALVGEDEVDVRGAAGRVRAQRQRTLLEFVRTGQVDDRYDLDL